MSPRGTAQLAIVRREIRSLVGSPTGWVVMGGAVAAVLGVATLSAPGGYQATAVDLLVVLEVLVPAVGVALGYRAVLHDRLSGEWAVHRAMGVRPRTYLQGVFIGQVTVVGLVIGGSLTVAMAIVAAGRARPVAFLASSPAVADPSAMLWLVGLSIGYAVPIVALVMLLSVWAQRRRDAILGAVVVVGLVVIGLDAAAIVTAVPLPVMVVLSPGAGYRALVLTVGVGLSAPGPVTAALLGWAVWTLVAVGVTLRRLGASP